MKDLLGWKIAVELNISEPADCFFYGVDDHGFLSPQSFKTHGRFKKFPSVKQKIHFNLRKARQEKQPLKNRIDIVPALY
jgi:hypothetical protein